MKLRLAMSVVALLCSAAVADVTAKKSQDSAKAVAKQDPGQTEKKPLDAAVELPKPSPEMKRLAHMIGGRWQVEEKYEVSPFTPHGGEGKGIEMIRRGPGGFSIILSYRSTGTMGEYQGNGIVSWSPADGVFQQFWVDSGAPGGELWQGRWEKDSLVFTHEQKVAEQSVHVRQTLGSFTESSFVATIDMGPSDAEMKRLMTFRYTRTGKQSAGMHRHGTGMHGRPMSDSWAGPRADATPR